MIMLFRDRRPGGRRQTEPGVIQHFRQCLGADAALPAGHYGPQADIFQLSDIPMPSDPLQQGAGLFGELHGAGPG